MNTAKTVTLDVREDIRCGREPFSKIMSTVAALNADEQLLLIAPFEPAPLFAVLGRQGFQHRSQSVANGDWEVLFTRQAGPAASAPPAATPPPCPERAALKTDADVLEVDARGLEPPQPLVKILEALATLPDGATLSARTDRRPMHLYAQLEERGFTGTSAAQSDGSFITQICRR